MYLNRKIDNTLVEWKNDPRHETALRIVPLYLIGEYENVLRA